MPQTTTLTEAFSADYVSAELPDDEAKTQLRQKINDYMLRAEYLKEWTAEQQTPKQQTQTQVGHETHRRMRRNARDFRTL